MDCLLAGRVEPGKINLSSYPYGGKVVVCGEKVFVNSRTPFEPGEYIFVGRLEVKGKLLVVNAERLFPARGEGLLILGVRGAVKGVKKGKGWYSFHLLTEGGELFCVAKEPVKEGWEVLVRGELKRKNSPYFLVDVEVVNPIVEMRL